MEHLTLSNGIAVPQLGMGTWYLGEKLSAREKDRLRRSLNHSLRLLRTDYLDLYLLHWRGILPLQCSVWRKW